MIESCSIKRMKKLSIAIRLTIWNLAIVAALELIFGATMWFTLRRNLYDLVDSRVQTQIEDLNQFLRKLPADAPLAQLQQSVSEKYSRDHGGDCLDLYLMSGELVYRSPSLEGLSSGLLPPDEVRRPMQRPLRVAGRPFHFLLQRMSANGRMFVVEMGAPSADAVVALRRFRFRLLQLGLLLWLGAGFLIYSISRRIMRNGPTNMSSQGKT